MKKFFNLFILILIIHFLAINPSYCKEDFFNNSNFEEAQESTKEKDKSSENKGYYGQLPDIYKDFKYKRQISNSSSEINAKIPTEEDLEEENLKRAPFDDPLFLDNIIKKEKDSQYLKDIQKIKFVFTSLKNCLEEQGDIQKFNGCVNLIDLQTQNLIKKYSNKSESLKESYLEILNTNYYAKVLGNLKFDAKYYSRYIPVQEGKYSKENIAHEENLLLNRVNRTIFLINKEE